MKKKNNYKSKDLYLIGNEMNNRVGTGNYDKERTKFNIKYKELEKDNLYQDVKYKLERRNIMPYLEPLFNIKVESFNIRHFELWRQSMNEKKISTRYKNGVYKYLKAVMNFGTKWYDLNFVKVYNKMTNFTNPNEKNVLLYSRGILKVLIC